MTQANLIKYAVLFLIVFGMGYATRNYMANAETTRRDLAEVKSLNKQLADANLAIEARDKANREINTKLNNLAQKSTETYNAQVAENSALRTDLDVLRGMRLKGTSCPVQPKAVEASTPGSVVNAPEVWLSAETGQLVFDLRADILSDQAKLDYLQNYVRSLGLDDPSKTE